MSKNENLFINKRMYGYRDNLLSSGKDLRGTNIVRMLQNYLKQKTNVNQRLAAVIFTPFFLCDVALLFSATK